MIKKNKSLTKLMIGVCCVLFAMIAFVIKYYHDQIGSAVRTFTQNEVLEVTEQGAHAFEVFIRKDEDQVHVLTRQLSKMKSDNERAIETLIREHETSVGKYLVVDLHSKRIFSDCTLCEKEVSDDRFAFYKKLPIQGVLEPQISEITGQRVLGSYQKFIFEDGIPGIAIKEESVAKIVQRFGLSFYDHAGFSYLINKKGKILVRSTHQDLRFLGGNILDAIQNSGSDPKKIANFMEHFERGDNEAFRFNLEGEEYVIALVAVKGVNGWFVVSIIPATVIETLANEIVDSTYSLSVGTFALLIIGLGLYLLSMQSKHLDEQQENERQKRDLIIETLGKEGGEIFVMLSSDKETIETLTSNANTGFNLPLDEKIETFSQLCRKIPQGNWMDLDKLDELPEGVCINKDFYVAMLDKNSTEKRIFYKGKAFKTELYGMKKYVILFSDRTEEREAKDAAEKLAELAESASKSKSEFLSNMSHDIRTPLNAILGISSLMLMNSGDKEKVQDSAKKILVSGEHLLGLINEILDMSKIESGKHVITQTEINLADLVEKIAVLTRPSAQTKGIDFNIELHGIVNEFLIGDEGRIRQILLNFLSNAVKYTPKNGKVSLEICQVPSQKQKIASFEFIVKDNGIGMSKEFQKVMYDPFTRATSSVVNQIQGTGLGLSIASHLIAAMGGTVRIDSELGKGTTVIVRLDLKIQDEEVNQNFWKNHDVEHILVVDDEKEMCEFVVAAMQGASVRIDTALSGYEAINKIEKAESAKDAFDLVLLDWKMPELNGLQVADRIRTMLKGKMPIIVLTAYDWSDIEKDARRNGVDGFLPKPFFKSNLQSLLSQLTDSKKVDNLQNQAQLGMTRLDGMHFLVAEDNDLNAEILLELLKMEGATADLAINGEEALEKFLNNPPETYQAVLMDVQMPIMDGYEATRKIRSSGKEDAEDIPILAMTANAFSEDIKAAFEAGMSDHLAKPIDISKFNQVLTRLVVNKGHGGVPHIRLDESTNPNGGNL